MSYSPEKHKLIQDYAWTLWEETFNPDTNPNYIQEKKDKIFNTPIDIVTPQDFGLHHLLLLKLCNYAISIETDNPCYQEFLDAMNELKSESNIFSYFGQFEEDKEIKEFEKSLKRK